MASVRYIVEHVDQAIAFYTTHLGFELAQQFGPAMAIVERDDLQLWLAGPQASASKPMPDGSKPAPGGWCRIVLTVTDLDKLATDLRENGVAFRNEVVSGPGGRQSLCDDPLGQPNRTLSAIIELVPDPAVVGAGRGLARHIRL